MSTWLMVILNQTYLQLLKTNQLQIYWAQMDPTLLFIAPPPTLKPSNRHSLGLIYSRIFLSTPSAPLSNESCFPALTGDWKKKTLIMRFRIMEREPPPPRLNTSPTVKAVIESPSTFSARGALSALAPVYSCGGCVKAASRRVVTAYSVIR